MATTVQSGIKSIKQVQYILQGLAAVADALGEVDDIDKLKRAAQGALTSVTAQLDAAKAELATIQSQVNTKLDQAVKEADRLVAEAKLKHTFATSYLEDAKAIEERTKLNAASLIADAEAKAKSATDAAIAAIKAKL